MSRDTIQSIFTLPARTNQVADKTSIKDGLAELFKSTQQEAALQDQVTNETATITKPLKDSLVAAPVKDTLRDTTQSQKSFQPETHLTDLDEDKKADSTNQLFLIDATPPVIINTPFTELFSPYRAFDKTTQISSTTRLNILQQNVDYKTSADFTTRYERSGEKNGDFLFDVSVTKLNTEVETMGVQLQYDSNKSEDSTSAFARPLFDIVGKKTFLQVDSTGAITAIDSSELGRQVSQVLSGLSLSGGDFELGSNLGLLLSKKGPFEVGNTWTDTLSYDGNLRHTTYTIKSNIDGDLLVLVSGTVSQVGEIISDGAVFKTNFKGSQQGKMYVDEETLLVKSRDITLNMTGTVDYNGQPLPASATSKIHEKVTHN